MKFFTELVLFLGPAMVAAMHMPHHSSQTIDIASLHGTGLINPITAEPPGPTSAHNPVRSYRYRFLNISLSNLINDVH